MDGSRAPGHELLVAHLLDAVGDGIVVTDAQGRFTLFNKAAERILGVGLTDTMPDQWSDTYGAFLPDGVTPFPVDDYPLVHALRGVETNNVEQIIRNSNVPQGVFISITGRPIRTATGEIVGAVVTFRDITLLHDTMEELRQAQAQKAELSALVVHDLKNPLSAVLGNAGHLLEQPKHDDETRECLRDMRYAAECMQRMVHDLLDIGASEHGKLIPRVERVGIESLLSEVQNAMSYCTASNNQAIAITVAPGVQTILADRELLRRVLQNLIDNSIKYAPQGTTIRVDARIEGADLALRVQDEGPGIPEQYRAMVFERYTKIERTDRQLHRESWGLGLRFCRVAVEALGGRIGVEVCPPHGTCFCVVLPYGATLAPIAPRA